jgi:hypothetical protein
MIEEMKKLLILLPVLILVAGGVWLWQNKGGEIATPEDAGPSEEATTPSEDEAPPEVVMEIKSLAFKHNSNIPPKYSCDGADVNPPLLISGVSGDAQSSAPGELSQPAPGKDTFRTDVMLKMFDLEWNLLGQTKVTDDVPANNQTLFAGRPHLVLVGNKIYVAYDSPENGRSEIFVKEYEVKND